MHRPRIYGRSRIFTPEMRANFCELVRESATIEEAAETLDVSLRTVQRERKGDEDFDHELRLALQAPPDPKKLMQNAARTHWRAAAWLLERTEPETYARKPVNTACPAQVTAALEAVVEAALQAVPPELRAEVYRHVQNASERALDCCFPNFGPWGNPRNPKPAPTPLREEQDRLASSAPGRRRPIADYDVEPDENHVEEMKRLAQDYAHRKAIAPLPARVAAQEERARSQARREGAPLEAPPNAPRRDPAPVGSPAASCSSSMNGTCAEFRTLIHSCQHGADGSVPTAADICRGILSPKRCFATKCHASGGVQPPRDTAPDDRLPLVDAASPSANHRLEMDRAQP